MTEEDVKELRAIEHLTDEELLFRIRQYEQAACLHRALDEREEKVFSAHS
jgi:hypothetical protein